MVILSANRTPVIHGDTVSGRGILTFANAPKQLLLPAPDADCFSARNCSTPSGGDSPTVAALGFGPGPAETYGRAFATFVATVECLSPLFGQVPVPLIRPSVCPLIWPSVRPFSSHLCLLREHIVSVHWIAR